MTENETPDVEWLADELRMIERAAELYPDSAYLQAQWLRAVTIVRATARGWLLDAPVVRVRGARD